MAIHNALLSREDKRFFLFVIFMIVIEIMLLYTRPVLRTARVLLINVSMNSTTDIIHIKRILLFLSLQLFFSLFHHTSFHLLFNCILFPFNRHIQCIIFISKATVIITIHISFPVSILTPE